MTGLNADDERDAEQSFSRLMFERVDSTVMAYLRIVMGIGVYLWADSYLSENKYMPIFVQPHFLYKYEGFEWVQRWPGAGMYWHFIVTKIAAVFLTIGLLSRVSAALLCASIAYVLLVERQIFVNHYYLLSCVAGLMVFLPVARRYSMDARLGLERHETTCSRWQLWFVRFQLGMPYMFGAFAKLNGDWMRGQPAEAILRKRTNLPGIGPLSEVPGAVDVMTYGGFLFDLLVVPLLLYRRTRWLAVAMALVFHLSNALILDIGVFPWFMLATLVVFFPPETLRVRLGKFLGQEQDVPSMESSHRKPTSWGRAGIWAAGIYVLIQLLLPLRPGIYPGNANWNERGHRFAWRMMLRDRQALTHYLVVDPKTGEYLYLPSTKLISGYQALNADHDPELIRQTAVQFEKYASENLNVQDCEVYALALVSLNCRKPTPMVDPNVDLTKVERGWWKDHWVLDDPGEFLVEPWTHPKEEWWQRLELPDRFRSLQGKTPSQLEAYLEELGRSHAGSPTKAN